MAVRNLMILRKDCSGRICPTGVCRRLLQINVAITKVHV